MFHLKNSSTFNGSENILRTRASECRSIGTFHPLCIHLQPYGHFGLSGGWPGCGHVAQRAASLCVRERRRRRARLASPRHDILCPSQRDDLRKHSSHSLMSHRGGSFPLSLAAGNAGLRFIAYVHPELPALPLLNPRTARRLLLLFLSERWLKSRTEHVGD